MKVKICESCGEQFAGNTKKCSDCINKEEERQKAIAQFLLLLATAVAGLFWYLPKRIHEKAGRDGVIIYFIVLASLGLVGYFYFVNNSHDHKPLYGKAAKELADSRNDGAQTEIVQEVYKPSFDCAKAQSKTEIAICGNSDLAKLDFQMVQLYKPLVGSFKESQKEWLNERNKCADNIDCLKSKYNARITFLKQSSQAVPANDGEEMLLDDDLVLDTLGHKIL
ncbi:MAG: hypothetical protein LBC75_11670 [Fibromonadaceae bacterium]|jgi:uncharacterized protein YecT (DUF1311 family)/predicted nucleic acid-binding Zn ribbon protein|nr:hypothetical protein [Fibromonadaceae bacterium]